MRTHTVAYLVCLLGTGLVGGVFLAFSSFIMSAFARLPAPQGIAAMQQINITVINPLFMVILFGTGVLAAYFLVGSFAAGRWSVVAASLSYLVGVLLVTMTLNVPLNNRLAALDPEAVGNAKIWMEYLSSWTFWNTVRCVAAAISCVLFAAGLQS